MIGFGLNNNFAIRKRTPIKKTIIILLILIVCEAIGFYAFIPSMNIHSEEFWQFQGFFVFAFLILSFSVPRKDKLKFGYNFASKITGIVLILGILVVIVGSIISAKLFNAHKFSSLIDIEDTKFENIISEQDSVNDIALMDTSSAKVVGQRAIGSLSDVVSQYKISSNYNQIAYKGKPMKVAPLEYAGFFKWFNNRGKGIPGYVLVDAVNFEAQYVKLKKPIKYTSSGWFNDNLERHMRMKFPTKIFEGYYFELDEDGNPYYVCPTLTAKVGMFGGYDVNGLVVCDPCTGNCTTYSLDKIPKWVDRVYDGDLIARKYNWYGSLKDGFWNSIIGQKDCKKVTDDYGYKVIDNDVWIYTGVTSVIQDSSNIGFIMANSRTGETKYFKTAGAEEYSSMDAAEGQVQNLGYTASFPSLINIGGQPTYFMVLKDKGNLVKQYALVNVKKYSIVSTGTTQKDTLSNYQKLLKQNNINISGQNLTLSDSYKSVTIIVSDVKFVNTDDGTVVYITDEKGNVYKEAFSSDEKLIFIRNNDKLKISYDENKETKIRDIEFWSEVNE